MKIAKLNSLNGKNDKNEAGAKTSWGGQGVGHPGNGGTLAREIDF